VAEDRRAGRVLLVDPDGAVLLFEGFDPGDRLAGRWWLTPGGGADEGEAIEAAAVREVFEETGLHVAADDLGPVVATRVAEFAFDGRSYRQSEWFFAVRTERFAPTTDGWEEVEHRSLVRSRWWTADELERSAETVYPAELAELLRGVVTGTLRTPMELSGD
jgi:8-oxo-dGTP pyrophosphatase MutT (NUDIX family)